MHHAQCSISSVYPRLTGPASAAALASDGPLPLACVSIVGPPLSSFTPIFVEVSDSRNNKTSCSRSRSNVPFEPITVRSEEHTSELQSHSDLVCRLLLEKKKKYNRD